MEVPEGVPVERIYVAATIKGGVQSLVHRLLPAGGGDGEVLREKLEAAEKDRDLYHQRSLKFAGRLLSQPVADPTVKDSLTVAAASAEPVVFQSRVAGWMQDCFGPVIAADKVERNHRFLEEALELVQACGCTADEAHKLVDYTFGRAVGEKSQEVGGVMVTLAALCLAQSINMQASAETELARIIQPEIVERIREKQKRKPNFSPLPGSYHDRTAQPQSAEPLTDGMTGALAADAGLAHISKRSGVLILDDDNLIDFARAIEAEVRGIKRGDV